MKTVISLKLVLLKDEFWGSIVEQGQWFNNNFWFGPIKIFCMRLKWRNQIIKFDKGFWFWTHVKFCFGFYLMFYFGLFISLLYLFFNRCLRLRPQTNIQSWAHMIEIDKISINNMEGVELYWWWRRHCKRFQSE